MPENQSPESNVDIGEQRAIWRRQNSTIPTLLGGKNVWVPLVFELLGQLSQSSEVQPESTPTLSAEIENMEHSSGGTVPHRAAAQWKSYFPFLRAMGLAEKTALGIRLTSVGAELAKNPLPLNLAVILADRVRLFAETLAYVAGEPSTLESVHEHLSESYSLSSKLSSNTRMKLDWQEKLGLITNVGDRRWSITDLGRSVIDGRTLVTPHALLEDENEDIQLAEPPIEVTSLLDELRSSSRTHESRSTYNIWVPSPPSNPNKVENLRRIINAALVRIDRRELFDFISETFDLARSSVESMLPFMKASGILKEVGKGIYEATPAARAWIESGDDINFVRILHANMRYVGEMIRFVEPDVNRNDMYTEAKKYGLNVDKARWIASFLLDTNLIEEPRYKSLRATRLGVALADELPLASPTTMRDFQVSFTTEQPTTSNLQVKLSTSERLIQYSQAPDTKGFGRGAAFESAVRDAFAEMGFETRLISGSGDTDVLVEWTDDEGSRFSAIVEAKSRSNGHVSHTDVSDVALETHKARNKASFVAIVGPSFAGDTIRNMAATRGWSLLEAEQLAQILSSTVQLGFRAVEVSNIFRGSEGIAALDELVSIRTRELEVLTFLISKLSEEVSEGGEPISARDVARDGRRTDLAPSAVELMSSIDLISRMQLSALAPIDKTDDPQYSTYVLGDVLASVRKLRALADALESGL
ncbi:restriction endonuclease [Neomicrococcus lactis]